MTAVPQSMRTGSAKGPFLTVRTSQEILRSGVLVRSERNSSMRPSRIVLLASLLACAIAVSGCANTVRGVGQDVKSTVKAVEQETE